MNGDGSRCVDAQANLVAANIDDGHFDIIADDNALVFLTGQYQHNAKPAAANRTAQGRAEHQLNACIIGIHNNLWGTDRILQLSAEQLGRSALLSFNSRLIAGSTCLMGI
jgi:hypothetical protein